MTLVEWESLSFNFLSVSAGTVVRSLLLAALCGGRGVDAALADGGAAALALERNAVGAVAAAGLAGARAAAGANVGRAVFSRGRCASEGPRRRVSRRAGFRSRVRSRMRAYTRELACAGCRFWRGSS